MRWRLPRPFGRIDLKALRRRTNRWLFVACIAAVAAIALLIAVWQARDSLAELDIEFTAAAAGEGLNVTWFGVSTLLFDDGETQILVDGYISRPAAADIAMLKPVSNDAATINYWLHEYGVWRLAAIIPSHTHFDHAMDIGAIANRSAASIIGSESAAAIARGAGVPDDQIILAEDDSEYTFGQFTVRLIRTPHAPVGPRGTVLLDGRIDEPLEVPAPVAAWRAGTSYSVLVSHPLHTTLVHASAGIGNTALEAVRADTVFLGVGMLEGLGTDYIRRYWVSTVTTSGAERVIPVHFDDYTQPFGDIRLPPALIDNVPKTFKTLESLRNAYDKNTSIRLPRFGVPIPLGAPEESGGSAT